MKLFLVYLGGAFAQANIELHDVRFVVGDTIEDTYPQLRQQWFGDLSGLHIDSYMQVSAIDGFTISLHTQPQQRTDKLFFVNFGGYYPDNIAEQHDFMLCVADSLADAKQRGRSLLLTDAASQHKDNLMELDNCFELAQIGSYYIHLEPGGNSQPMRPDWSGYNVIG